MLRPYQMNLSKGDMQEIGRVAAWSSMLDTAMEVSIWLLLDVPRPEARQMTHGMNADRRRQWLVLLSKSNRLDNAKRATIEGLLTQIAEAIQDRNKVIHGLWHIGSDGLPWAAKYSDKGNLTFHKRLDAPLIHPIAEEAKRLACELAEWNEALEPGSMSSSFPQIPPQPVPGQTP